MLSQQTLFNFLDYDATTGVFKWKVKNNRTQLNQAAGFINNGYVRIKLQQKTYLAHRLAWLYVFGEWPKNEIDHINGDRRDNRVSNLREAEHAQNMRNRKGVAKIGLKGVYKCTGSKNWHASCTVSGVKYYLGTYSTPEQAHSAYADFAVKNHGPFVNLGVTHV